MLPAGLLNTAGALPALAHRLREERQRIRKDQAGFAALGGVGKTTQIAYEQGRTAPNTEYLLRLAEHDVDVGYVLTGTRTTTSDFESSLQQLHLKMIPEVDIAYSMGGGSLVGSPVDERWVPFRRDWLDRLTRGFKADVFLSRGQGDSMMPTILDDDDVLVNRADNVVQHQDRIWALGYGELGMIKRVRRLPGGQFQLNSDNPAVTSIEATEDELFIVGRVIWIGRRV